MTKITQSTLAPLVPDKVFELLQVTPEHLELPKNKPAVYYVAEDGLKTGSLIRYTLVYGVVRFSWLGKIRQIALGDRIECTLQEGPFQNWTSTHLFAREGRNTSIRDTMECECSSDKLLEILETVQFIHGFKSRSEVRNSDTIRMKAIGRNMA